MLKDFEDKKYINQMIKDLKYPNNLSELKNKNVLVGVSGGLDSVVCLNYLIKKGFYTFPVCTPKTGLAGKSELIHAIYNYNLLKKQAIKNERLRDLYILKFSRPCFPNSYAAFTKRNLIKKHYWIDYFMLTKITLNCVDLCYEIESKTKEKIRIIFHSFIKDDIYENPGETLTSCLQITKYIRSVTKDDSWLILPPFLGFINKRKYSKVDVINLGSKIGVDLSNTFSCKKKFLHCGVCDGCQKRITAFKNTSIKDNTTYLNKSSIILIIIRLEFMLKSLIINKICPNKNIHYLNDY